MNIVSSNHSHLQCSLIMQCVLWCASKCLIQHPWVSHSSFSVLSLHVTFNTLLSKQLFWNLNPNLSMCFVPKPLVKPDELVALQVPHVPARMSLSDHQWVQMTLVDSFHGCSSQCHDLVVCCSDWLLNFRCLGSSVTQHNHTHPNHSYSAQCNCASNPSKCLLH